MHLYKVRNALDQVAIADPQWAQNERRKRACHKCDYLLGRERGRPLDVFINHDAPKWPLKALTAPLISVSSGDKVVRRDLADDLLLDRDGVHLGAVYVNGKVLAHYRSLVIPANRWLLVLTPRTMWVYPCETCDRLLMNSASDGDTVVKESIQGKHAVYTVLGTSLLITPAALKRVRRSIREELVVSQIPVRSLKDGLWR